jgi:hypothetical protein
MPLFSLRQAKKEACPQFSQAQTGLRGGKLARIMHDTPACCRHTPANH